MIAYYRVSTQRQGQSGLGLEAQKAAVLQAFGSPSYEYTDIESGARQRPVLDAAIAQTRKEKSMLVVAKLDRLARDLHFVTSLHKAGVEFRAADMPHANRLTIQIISAMAEYEREQISERTKAAIASWNERHPDRYWGEWNRLTPGNEVKREAAREFAEKLRPVFERYPKLSHKHLAIELNTLGVTTFEGCAWSRSQVRRVRLRL